MRYSKKVPTVPGIWWQRRTHRDGSGQQRLVEVHEVGSGFRYCYFACGISYRVQEDEDDDPVTEWAGPVEVAKPENRKREEGEMKSVQEHVDETIAAGWKVHPLKPDQNEVVRRLSWENGLLRGMLIAVLGDMDRCGEHGDLRTTVKQAFEQLPLDGVEWQAKETKDRGERT